MFVFVARSHLVEPLGGVDGVVGEREVRARALDGDERLKHGVLLVEVPGGGGRLSMEYSPDTHAEMGSVVESLSAR